MLAISEPDSGKGRKLGFIPRNIEKVLDVRIDLVRVFVIRKREIEHRIPLCGDRIVGINRTVANVAERSAAEKSFHLATAFAVSVKFRASGM